MCVWYGEWRAWQCVSYGEVDGMGHGSVCIVW